MKSCSVESKAGGETKEIPMHRYAEINRLGLSLMMSRVLIKQSKVEWLNRLMSIQRADMSVSVASESIVLCPF